MAGGCAEFPRYTSSGINKRLKEKHNSIQDARDSNQISNKFLYLIKGTTRHDTTRQELPQPASNSIWDQRE